MKKKSIIIVSKLYDPRANKAKKDLIDFLSKKHIESIDLSTGSLPITSRTISKALLGVAIGGDGTFLHFIQRLEDRSSLPIMGINLGTLGFITGTDPAHMGLAIENFLEKKYQIEKKPLFKVELCTKDVCRKSGVIVNDVVIIKKIESPMVQLSIKVNNEILQTIRADGYIISTPTGSTAYNLSMGGPLIQTGVNALVLTPLCPHSVMSRSVVVMDHAPIEIELGLPSCLSKKQNKESKDSNVVLVLDGQLHYDIRFGEAIRITPQKEWLQVVQASSWIQTLKEKLKFM